MSDLGDLMDAMADKLRDAFGDWDPKVEVSSRMQPTPSETPFIDIYPAAESARSTDALGFGDIDGAFAFTVRARITTADPPASQEALLEMMDDQSDRCVRAILQADQTLDDLASTVHVNDRSGFGVYQDVMGEGAYLGLDWTVTVIRA